MTGRATPTWSIEGGCVENGGGASGRNGHYAPIRWSNA
jgi:hypothetical protein